MEPHSDFEIPLETLTQGVHSYSYKLTDAFFEAFESQLVEGGLFDVRLEVERIRNQFNLELSAEGAARVSCDRCLESFLLPIEVADSSVIKFDSENPRVEEHVIFIPYGTERFNVAKLIYDAIGLSLPIGRVHEMAGLVCDPEMTKYLSSAEGEEPSSDENTTSNDIPEDSPWSVLRNLDQQEN